MNYQAINKNEEVNYAQMYGNNSNKFIAGENKDNALDNLYDAIYRLANATHTVTSLIKTNNEAIQAAALAINSKAIELEKSIGLNEPAAGQTPATPNVN